MIKRICFIFLLLIIPQMSWANGMFPAKSGKKVRILLASKQKEIDLQIPGGYKIFDGKKNIYSKPFGSKLNIQVNQNSLKINNKKIKSDDIIIYPRKELRFQGKRYRGLARIFFQSDGQLSLVNILDVEDYLKSVVPGEISAGWPKEALRAQAVAARTYAYYHMAKNKEKRADVMSSLAQNYGGIQTEDPRSTEAVLVTKGQVLTYRGALFPAFFHSTCGGGTEYPQNVWPLDFKIPETSPCQFCRDSPHYHWQAVMSVKEIEKKFKEAKKPLSHLISLYPSKMSKTKTHVTELVVEDHQEKHALRINDLRQILGYNVIKSSKFQVQKKGDKFVFVGQGWGHGVGLCQWGSRGIALKNKSYKKILTYYYPGSKIRKL